MSRTLSYLWFTFLVCSSHSHIGYGARIDPRQNSNPSKNLSPLKVAQEKCQEYTLLRHNVIQPNGTVILQSPSYAQEGEFPHMALIGNKGNDPSNVEWICGGSLISPQYILTVAQCNDPTNSALTPTWVVLGQTTKPSNNMTTSRLINNDNVYRIVERINHPEYRPLKIEKNIALFKLDRPVVLKSTIRPLCLALPSNAKYDSKRAIVTGWGAVKAGAIQSEKLKKVSISILDNIECIKAYENATRFSKCFDAKSMICAGPVKQSEGGTCEGDSGGPLQFYIDSPEHNGMWFQTGIVSYGSVYCDDRKPEIFTRVSNFLPWIQSIVWPAY